MKRRSKIVAVIALVIIVAAVVWLSSATPGPGTTARRSPRPGWWRWPSAAPTPSSRPRSTPTPWGRRPWRSGCCRGCAPRSCSPPTAASTPGQRGTPRRRPGRRCCGGPRPSSMPVIRGLDDGTYLTVLIKPSIRGRRRERLLAAARDGRDLTDINTVPDAFDERGLPVIHLARVIEYDVPNRVGNGTGEVIVLLTTILN